jgi:hypothetical protein
MTDSIPWDTDDKPARPTVMAFGRWLLQQRGRDDHIGRLADYAAKDRGFPRNGTSRQVQQRILGQAFDEDAMTALEDALTEWRTLRPLP